ncbi:MAG: hypothetical protein Q4G60_11585 [bacterium]|nr:hypothetical protein [bacterium]
MSKRKKQYSSSAFIVLICLVFLMGCEQKKELETKSQSDGNGLSKEDKVSWESFHWLDVSQERYPLDAINKIMFWYKDDFGNSKKIFIDLQENEMGYCNSAFHWKVMDHYALTEEDKEEVLSLLMKYEIQKWKDYNAAVNTGIDEQWELQLENPNHTREIHAGTDYIPNELEGFTEKMMAYVGDRIDLLEVPESFAPMTAQDLETFRGIKIGDNADDVFTAFGYPIKEASGGTAESILWWTYTYETSELTFSIDLNKGGEVYEIEVSKIQ